MVLHSVFATTATNLMPIIFSKQCFIEKHCFMGRPIYIGGLPALHYGKPHILVVCQQELPSILTPSIKLEDGAGV